MLQHLQVLAILVNLQETTAFHKSLVLTTTLCLKWYVCDVLFSCLVHSLLWPRIYPIKRAQLVSQDSNSPHPFRQLSLTLLIFWR